MKSEPRYIPFQPMKEDTAKFLFKEIIPEDIERYILTEKYNIEVKALNADSFEKIQYLKGKRDGLTLFHKMIKKFAEGERKEKISKAKSNIKEMKDKDRAQGGLIISKKS